MANSRACAPMLTDRLKRSSGCLPAEDEGQNQSMHDIELIIPEKAHTAKADALKREFFEHGENVIHGSGLYDQMEYDQWLTFTEKNRNAKVEETAWAPSTTFFAVRKSDSELVGMIDVRHHILHPYLRDYAGHIGYAVRPSKRKKGYATQMLSQALAYAKQLDIDRVMLGCYRGNVASMRTIEKNGGVKTKEVCDPDGRMTNIYWIEL